MDQSMLKYNFSLYKIHGDKVFTDYTEKTVYSKDNIWIRELLIDLEGK